MKKYTGKLRKIKSGFEINKKLRMTVFRSNKSLYVQVIDDDTNFTLASISTKSLNLKSNIESVEILAQEFSKTLKEKNILNFYFDRNKFPFKGKIKKLADSLRNFGINF